jgi:zinc transport system ATP-binding protein
MPVTAPQATAGSFAKAESPRDFRSDGSSPLLSVRDLTVLYQTSIVLERVRFDIASGEYVGIVGPNGSGKTTLIKAILGLVELAEGDVRLFGESLSGFSRWDRVGYLPQMTTLPLQRFPATVAEVVSMGLLARKTFPKRLSKADEEAVDRALSLVGVSSLRSRFIGRLSGGQRQRVFLARALVSEPELLVLDEPVTALDPDGREQFYQTVERLNRQLGTSVLLVSHDSATIGKYASKILYLDRKVVFFGAFGEFCGSEEVTRYLGGAFQHLVCRQHHHHESHV